jgi:lysophospholipase L1-like esterase
MGIALASLFTSAWVGAAQAPAARGGAAPAPGAGAPAQGAGGAQRGARGRGGAGGPAAPATVPLPRDNARHQSFVALAKAGNIELLFVGDSITDLWDDRAKPVWDANFGQFKPANFGISGDTTQGVLWRMQNGELEGFKAKLIVLMLGTNNINRNPNDDIVEGDRLIVEEFKKRQPQAKVLVLGIFPRGASANDPNRATIKEINSKLAKFADGKQVFYMDIGDKFLTADGTLTTEIMNDGLHPTAKGYEVWAAAIIDKVKELTGGAAANAAPSVTPATAPSKDAEIEALAQAACGGCHGYDLVTEKRGSKSDWNDTVTRMVDRGALLEAPQVPTVVEFLARKYPLP